MLSAVDLSLPEAVVRTKDPWAEFRLVPGDDFLSDLGISCFYQGFAKSSGKHAEKTRV